MVTQESTISSLREMRVLWLVGPVFQQQSTLAR